MYWLLDLSIMNHAVNQVIMLEPITNQSNWNEKDLQLTKKSWAIMHGLCLKKSNQRNKLSNEAKLYFFTLRDVVLINANISLSFSLFLYALPNPDLLNMHMITSKRSRSLPPSFKHNIHTRVYHKTNRQRSRIKYTWSFKLRLYATMQYTPPFYVIDGKPRPSYAQLGMEWYGYFAEHAGGWACYG